MKKWIIFRFFFRSATLAAQSFKQPPEGPSTKRVTLIMVGFRTSETTIKSKHDKREELMLMEKHRFLATVASGQLAASWGEGKKNCKRSARVRFWVGPHWVGPSELVNDLGLSPSTVGSPDWLPESLRIKAHQFSRWLCRPYSETP